MHNPAAHSKATTTSSSSSRISFLRPELMDVMDRERRSSSVTVLSERGSNKAGMARRRKFMIIGVVVVLAAVGAAVGIVVSKNSSSSSSTSSGDNSSGTSGGTSSSGGATSSGGNSTSKWETSASSGSGSNGTTVSKITSDPTTATLSLAAFAIGDWGSTVGKDSCCGDSSTYTEFDVIAEDVVATLMDLQAGAATVKPKAIIGHGDNFYWAGIQGDNDQSYRFTNTFEKKFTGSNLADIPWVNVLGNHDYGGSSFICTKDGELAECESTDAMLEALEKKFTWQSKYTSPNGDRWKLEDHFYTHSISDSASGVSIDIFNVDANDADTHGALQICCQCYGYAEGDDSQCNNVAPGQKYCAGGSMDMYNKCMAKISSWADDSRTQLAEKVKASTATWKIVNSHYSPYVHYAETGMKKWFDILDGSGVQLWMNGHTHGEKHDFSSPLAMHFVENGAGGGIQKESASGIPAVASAYVKNKWTYGGNEYGFFSVTAGKEWLKLQYHTADTKWTFAETIGAAKAGGVATKHCWYIPVDGSEGQDCTSS